jgi:hypothetical protein
MNSKITFGSHQFIFCREQSIIGSLVSLKKLIAPETSMPTAPDLLRALENLMACEKGHIMGNPNHLSRRI